MTNIFQYSIFILLIGSLAVSATGCDFIYGLLQKEGAEERKVLGQMSPLEANAEVRRVQTFLKIYGYNVGNPDGVMGMNTRLALGKFQEDNDLKPSRFVDYETWGRLLFHEEIGLIKDGKLHIESVQQALTNTKILIDEPITEIVSFGFSNTEQNLILAISSEIRVYQYITDTKEIT